MAILPDLDRQEAWKELMSDISEEREAVQNLPKQGIKDAIDATDDWIEANQSSYNSALPLPARNNLTQKQKAMLFMYVASKRYGVL